MSDETRDFIRGFLSAYEPDPPYDDDVDITDADDTAWRSAIRRFRHTGYWTGRWRTCEACGCVLLPDTASSRCHAHHLPEEP